MGKCSVCGRELKDPNATVGPICGSKGAKMTGLGGGGRSGGGGWANIVKDDEVQEFDPDTLGRMWSQAPGLVEDTHFTYVAANLTVGECRLRIWNVGDGKLFILVSELDDNPGASVTNAAGAIARKLLRMTKKDPDQLVFAENYRDEPPDEVIHTWEGRSLKGTTWKRMAHDAVHYYTLGAL